MGIIDWINSVRTGLSKNVRVFNASDVANSKDLPYLTNWMYATKLGKPRGINVQELRKYAKCAWIQMVTKAIIKQIKTTDWDIMPIDEESDQDITAQQEEAKQLLTYPNRNGETFGDIWGAWMKDLLEIDSGVLFKARNSKGKLAELFVYDGSTFLVDLDEHGVINGYYQYSFRHPQAVPLKFEKNELVYGVMNIDTENYPYGWAPLQSVVQEVELLINGTRWNKEFFQRSAIPDGILSAKMEEDQLNRFKEDWKQEVQGKPHKLMIHNAEGLAFTQLNSNNRDMEWLEGQKWYFHLLFAAYGLSPAEVGFYEDVNRSAQEGQERVTVKNAIKPYLKLIADKINREILPELFDDIKVEFKWQPKDHVAEEIEHKQTMAKLGANVYTINEVRRMEGKEDVEWGDQPMAMGMQDRAAEQQDEFNNSKEDSKANPKDKEKDKDKKEEPEEKKEESKKNLDLVYKSIENEEIVDDSKDYVEFLRKHFDQWETNILKAVDETLQDEVLKSYDDTYIKKTFSQFLSRIFNTVNTAYFLGGLKKVIRISLKNGINDAEDELSLDIGTGDMFEQRVKYHADRQLEGFNVGGKRWTGLKGVSRNLTTKVYKTVQEGLRDKKGLGKIKNEIKDIMAREKGGEVAGEVTEGRSMRIARTETNRFRNGGRLQAYGDSGLKGKKQWVSLEDDKTTDICKRLDGQKVELNDLFVDPKTGKEFMHPPALPNCRSVMRFVFED